MDSTGEEEPVRPTHIGAIDSWGHTEFDCYVWPERDIQEGHSDLYVEEGQLYREWYTDPLPCLDLEEALQAFIDWLWEVDGNVVLVAHGSSGQDPHQKHGGV